MSKQLLTISCAYNPARILPRTTLCDICNHFNTLPLQIISERAVLNRYFGLLVPNIEKYNPGTAISGQELNEGKPVQYYHIQVNRSFKTDYLRCV